MIFLWDLDLYYRLYRLFDDHIIFFGGVLLILKFTFLNILKNCAIILRLCYAYEKNHLWIIFEIAFNNPCLSRSSR